MPEVVELLDGRVLVIGGLGAGGETLSSCELYDPETDRFVETGPMASPRARHKAALLPDGRVLVTGGAGLLDIEGDPMGTLESTRSSIELYDPTTGTWSPGPEMQIPRVTHAIATLPGGDVLITGGLTWSGGAPSVSTHVELFEFESGTLRETADLPEGRAEHTLTALSDGRILVTGGGAIQLGASFDITALSASAVYDPASGDWSEGAAMSTGRAGHTGLVLEDGRVLVPGGDSGTLLEMTPTDTCEIYDPDADAWTDTAALPVPLVGYVGFVEAEGRVLIAGGTDGSSTSDAALLFEPVEGAR